MGDGSAHTEGVRSRKTLKDGTVISLLFREHPSPRLPGLVVLIHGRLHTAVRGPCAVLARDLPYSTLTFDARGMGESTGTTGWSNHQEEVRDLGEILQHVASEFAPPHNRVLALVGHSKGAVVALGYGSLSPSPPHLRVPLIVSLSARYDTSSLSPSGLNRFTPEQREELERTGRCVWLRYRAGPEPDRPERRDYVVTKEAIADARGRTLEAVRNLPGGTQVLLLHGRADGTVPCGESVKVDRRIRESEDRSVGSDLVLVEGVKHNWDGEGELDRVAWWVSGWVEFKTKELERGGVKRVMESEVIDHLGLDRQRA